VSADFKEMHQFPLGLCPIPRCWSLQHSLRPLAVFKGSTSKKREKGKKEMNKRGGKGREVKGRTTLRTSCRKFLATPLKGSTGSVPCACIPRLFIKTVTILL